MKVTLDSQIRVVDAWDQFSVRCFLGEELVASCLCQPYWNGKAHVMLVDDVLVPVEHRGRGYSEELMRVVREFAVSRKIDSVELTVNEDNVVARSLYRKMGFEETDKKYCRLILNRW